MVLNLENINYIFVVYNENIFVSILRQLNLNLTTKPQLNSYVQISEFSSCGSVDFE